MQSKMDIEDGEQLFLVDGKIMKFGECERDRLQRDYDAISISFGRTSEFLIPEDGRIDIAKMRETIRKIKDRDELELWAMGAD